MDLWATKFSKILLNFFKALSYIIEKHYKNLASLAFFIYKICSISTKKFGHFYSKRFI